MKIKYFTAIPLLGVLAACDPAIDEVDSKAFYSASDLETSVIITQPYAGYPDVLRFTTSPAKSIQIIDELGGVVASGCSCDSFKLAPGVSGNLTIKGLSQDGKEITISKSVTVDKYTNVPDSWYKITGNTGGTFINQGEWYWDEISNGACWGNAGYLAGLGDPSNVPGKWWGAKISELSGQLQHAVGGALTGEESPDAKMVISGGQIIKYSGDGSVLATGTFTIKDAQGADLAQKVADLTTTNNVVLFPYQINGGGKYVNNFEVTYLDDNYMQLIYAPAGTGSWSECTWWEFKKKDAPAYVNPAAYEKWTHDKYLIVNETGKALTGAQITAVSNDKLTISYVSLNDNFIFKAQTITSDNSVTVPEGTTFEDITPSNSKLFKVYGKDTTEVTVSGSTFAPLDPDAKYDITVTYDKKAKSYSVYYKEFEKASTTITLIAHASSNIFVDKDNKATADSLYTGEKSVSGSITTYTFKDIKFKKDGNEFYFSNLVKENKYLETFDFNNIEVLKGDEDVFGAGSSADGKTLIKLADKVKEPVTIILSIYEKSNGTKTVYLSVTGAKEKSK
jgi:hypothetical protein